MYIHRHREQVANTSGHHFFVWTLVTLGVIAFFSFVLAVEGLWRLEWRGLPRYSKNSAKAV